MNCSLNWSFISSGELHCDSVKIKTMINSSLFFLRQCESLDWSDCLVVLLLSATHFRKSGHARLRGRPFNSWGGRWVILKKNFLQALVERKKCMQHKCNRELMGKKGKKYPAHHIAGKKNSWWPEITHPHPQELNGRPLIRGCFSFSQCFREAFSLLSPRPLPAPFDSPYLLLSSGSFNMSLSRANWALKENACTAGYERQGKKIAQSFNVFYSQK